MTHPRGAVVVADDPFGRTPRRPYLIVSDDHHPFVSMQYIAIGITTSNYDEAFPIRGHLTDGTLKREAESQAAPWAVVTLKHSNITKRIAQIEQSLIDTVAHAAVGYLGLES